jgi:thiamine biosynthesis lipoprotein
VAGCDPDVGWVLARGEELRQASGGYFDVRATGILDPSERGAHVIDPLRGRPADALASVTVVGPDLTWADAHATTALAMGLDAPEWLEELAGHEAYLIDAGGHVWWTEGFGRYAPALAEVPQPRR